MVKVGIIGAMDEEVELYIKELDFDKKEVRAGLEFHFGKINGTEVVIVKSGVGKINAAVCTQILIGRFGADKIIFTGVAGALNSELDILDIVISDDTVQHDMDARGLGVKKGQIPYTDYRFFKADKELVSIADSIDLDVKKIRGRVLTGDQFITDQRKTEEIKAEFGGDCVDMESAAVGFVCALNETPFLAIRSISDRADHAAEVDFPKFCKDASKNSYFLVNKILERI